LPSSVERLIEIRPDDAKPHLYQLLQTFMGKQQLVQILGVPTPAVEFDCQPGMSAHQLLSQLLVRGLSFSSPP
jgi:hypothetical protein